MPIFGKSAHRVAIYQFVRLSKILEPLMEVCHQLR